MWVLGMGSRRAQVLCAGSAGAGGGRQAPASPGVDCAEHLHATAASFGGGRRPGALLELPDLSEQTFSFLF